MASIQPSGNSTTFSPIHRFISFIFCIIFQITTIHKTHTNDINNNYNINKTNYNTSNIIVLTLATYLELDEEDQQKLWLQAQASNSTNLINRLLPLWSNNLDTAFPKLIKELLTQRDKNNVPELRFDPHPNKWCLLYTNRLARLLPIIKMFSKTAPVYDNETIILFDDPSCICNQALFMHITTKVNNFYCNMLHFFTDHRDQALKKLLAVFFPSYLHTSRLLLLKNYLISYISTPSLVNIYYSITLLNPLLHLNPSFLFTDDENIIIMFPPIFPNEHYHTLSSLTFTNLKLFTNTVDNETLKTIDTLPKDTSSIFSSLSSIPIQTALWNPSFLFLTMTTFTMSLIEMTP